MTTSNNTSEFTLNVTVRAKDGETVDVGFTVSYPQGRDLEACQALYKVGRLESINEIAAGLINDEGWDE